MNKRGFTLVEVLAVIAIIAILVTIAGTSFIKKYDESKRNALVIQEGQLVQSGDLVINDYCKNPLNKDYQLKCDHIYKSALDDDNSDNLYTKYICISQLKELGYYSEDLVYSGNNCSGVVIYKIDEDTDKQLESYSVIRCGEDYISDVENAREYVNKFSECFETINGEPGEGPVEEEKEYTLVVNFTKFTPNGSKVAQSINQKYKNGQSISIDVPSYFNEDDEFTAFKHGTGINDNGFTLNSSRNKLSGIMPSKDVTVNIVYDVSKYTLTVNYKEFNNVTGNITFPSRQFTLFYGEEIEIPYDNKANFRVISPGSMTYVMPQRDTSIDVIYQQQQFNLSYNMNGGSGCSNRKVGYTSSYGALCTPTRVGYRFQRWELANGSEVNSSTINNNYRDVTLYARWTPIKYNVIYSCNGGTPTNNYTSEHTYDSSQNLTANRCEKRGYILSNWLGEDGRTFSDMQSVINLKNTNGATYLVTAQWTPLSYTIAFGANGGTGSMSSISMTYGRVFNLPANKFTRVGHRFDGWLSSYGINYSSGEAVSNLTTIHNDVVTMTARWTKCSAGTYLVNNVCTSCPVGTYSSGGVNSCTSCPAGTYTGTTGASSCSTCTAGYYCPGGSNRVACAAGKYNSSTGATSASACTNCAVGKYSSAGATTCTNCAAGTYSTGGASSCSTCTAGYYCPGGSNRVACAAGKYNSSTGATSASACTNCAAGKYSSAGATTCTNCAAGTYSTGGASSCSTCTAGYYCPGGSNRIACAAGKYNSSTGATSASGCTNCAAGKYSSAGATTCTNCPTGHTSNAGSSSCTKINYTVTIGRNNTSYGTVSSGSVSIPYGTTYSVSSNKITFSNGITVTASPSSLSGYITAFSGWSSNSGTITGNTTINANFSATGINYSVVYNCNGGNPTTTYTSSHVYGTSKALSDNQCSKTGYNFAGWTTNADGTGTAYSDKQSVNNLTSTSGGKVNLYAKWTAKTYTLTFNANGGSVSTSSKTITYNQAYGDLPVPTRAGYMFVGWFLGTEKAARDSSVSYLSRPFLYYADAYGDLYNAFQYNDESLYTHYIKNGTSEGRRISPYISSDIMTGTSGFTLYAGWYKVPASLIQIGKYVSYSGGGYTSWRVMYNNSGQIDLISSGSVKDVTLDGNGGYVNSVETLYNHAQGYITGYATSARALGQNADSQMSISVGSTQTDLSYYPYTDSTYTPDVNHLNNYGLVQSDKAVWLTSRYGRKGTTLFGNVMNSFGHVLFLNTNGSVGGTGEGDYLQNYTRYGWIDDQKQTKGFRPVVSLQSGLYIASGKGTSNDPFVLTK